MSFDNDNYEDSEEEFVPEAEIDDEMSSEDELSDDEFKPTEDIDLETSFETLEVEEQESTEDPVRLYLHEIGKVRLLTAKDERILAKKVEMAKRLKEIKQDHFQGNDESPTAVELLIALLREIGQSVGVIHLIQEQLDITPDASFFDTIKNTKLLENIADVINQQLVQAIAYKIGKPISETEQVLINLSLNFDLIPLEILEIIGHEVSLDDMEKLVTSEEFIDSIKIYETKLQNCLSAFSAS